MKATVPHHAAAAPSAAAVLTKATLRAASLLGMVDRELAAVVGISEATVSRLRGGRTIAPESKEGQLALLFVRLFRSLDALLGGDTEKCRAWFGAHNDHLAGRPAELAKSVTGLVHVVEYLDALRGKV